MSETARRWPDGLSAAIDGMKPLVSESYNITSEALRRVWKARDEVERLRRLLANAEVALTTAEREHADRGEEMQMIWGEFRAKVEQIPLRGIGASGDDDVPAEREDNPDPLLGAP